MRMGLSQQKVESISKQPKGVALEERGIKLSGVDPHEGGSAEPLQ